MQKEKSFGFFSQINKNATIRGSINSTLNNTRRGASAITAASSLIKDGASEVISEARVESFNDALARLDVNEEDLPLIHNQILFQSYVSFAFFIISIAVSISFLYKAIYPAAVIAFVISLASFANFAQSSIRTYQIRTASLGNLFVWAFSFHEWLPPRMDSLVKMEKIDPLFHDSVVSDIASKARFSYSVFLFFAFTAVASYYSKYEHMPDAWWICCLIVGIISLFS